VRSRLVLTKGSHQHQYQVSTALWTGVYLADVLDHVRPIYRQAKYVVFEGGDNLPNGPYGTSQRLSWASNKDKGMLICNSNHSLCAGSS
jgi:DMSO/TMAO reductase YedYZ molybdopterin-dependent catalytic subunit